MALRLASYSSGLINFLLLSASSCSRRFTGSSAEADDLEFSSAALRSALVLISVGGSRREILPPKPAIYRSVLSFTSRRLALSHCIKPATSVILFLPRAFLCYPLIAAGRGQM